MRSIPLAVALLDAMRAELALEGHDRKLTPGYPEPVVPLATVSTALGVPNLDRARRKGITLDTAHRWLGAWALAGHRALVVRGSSDDDVTVELSTRQDIGSDGMYILM